MTAFRINDDEQEILRRSELSHPAKLLYLLGLRPYMDYRTAIVGKARRISYQQLHEVLEFIPLPGSQRGKGDYTQSAIRNLIIELERMGLVRRLPNDHRALFLECLVADREDASKNRNVRGTSQSSVRGTTDINPCVGKGFDVSAMGSSDTCCSARSVTPPVSGKPSISGIAAAAQQRAVVDEMPALLLPDEMAAWLRAAEKRRGKIVRVSDADALLKAWSLEGVGAEELKAAHAAAVADREARGEPAPITPGFLRVFLDRARVRAGVGREEKPWFVTAPGIEAKGRAFGLQQQAGEAFPYYRLRVLAAAGISDEEARRWQA